MIPFESKITSGLLEQPIINKQIKSSKELESYLIPRLFGRVALIINLIYIFQNFHLHLMII